MQKDLDNGFYLLTIEFSFPISRIKNIINSDESNKRTKKTTVLYVEKATVILKINISGTFWRNAN
jgi:hypothetical protein